MWVSAQDNALHRKPATTREQGLGARAAGPPGARETLPCKRGNLDPPGRSGQAGSAPGRAPARTGPAARQVSYKQKWRHLHTKCTL